MLIPRISHVKFLFLSRFALLFDKMWHTWSEQVALFITNGLAWAMANEQISVWGIVWLLCV